MINEKRAGIGMILVLLVAFGSLVLWYGSTEVAFKIEGGDLYRKIKNGRIGANCYDESGMKVIAPSRFVGPEWVKVMSLKDVPEDGKIFSATCFTYDVVGASREPISSSTKLAHLQ